MSKQFKPKNHNEFKFLQAYQTFEECECKVEHQPNSAVVNNLENQATTLLKFIL